MGTHDGTWTSAPALVAPVMEGTSNAIYLNGTRSGTIPHTSALALSAGTVAVWAVVHAIPTVASSGWFTKEQSGFNNGDFGVYMEDDGLTYIQFQDTSGPHRVELPNFEIGVPHCVVATFDGTGFSGWLDGQFHGKVTAFTGGWSSNANAIQIAAQPFNTHNMECTIAYAAVWGRLLSDSEIIALSLKTSPPIAGNLTSVDVQEGSTLTIDPAGVPGTKFVGRKSNLEVTKTNGASGAVTVNGSNDLVYTPGSVSADTNDSFTYTIRDANGVSSPGTIALTIRNNVATGSGDGFGGTLVYQWAPLLAWTSGALSTRNAAVVRQLSRWTDPAAATVGSSLPISVASTGGQTNYCFNRAPTGEPSIELATQAGQHYPMGIAVQLWPKMATNPRHIRLVLEVMTSRSGHATTHKSAGIGTTTGAYTNFSSTHLPGGFSNETVSMKYMLGTAIGNAVLGAGSANWWNNHTFPIDRAYFSTITGSAAPGFLRLYAYAFGRPASSQYGYGSGVTTSTGIDDVGIHGVWHRLEFEFKMSTPGSVPNNARRHLPINGKYTEPNQTGDGFVKIWMTKDIDNLNGSGAGTRFQVCQLPNLIMAAKFDDVGSDDNMHLLANPWALFLYLFYGGADTAQTEAWAWIRKAEAYRYTADDI